MLLVKFCKLVIIEIIIVDIIKGKVIKGGFPSKQLKMIFAWTIIHQDELMQNWELSKDGKTLNRINPLI